jgi:hypothetical protein
MRKLTLLAVFTLCITSLHAFSIKNPSGRFELGAGPSLSLSTGYEVQAVYNTNETFYAGVRFSGGNQYFYYSAVSGVPANEGYLTTFSDISLVLGAQFVQFNERFNMFFDLLPGFAFAARDRGTGAAINYGPVIFTKTLGTETQTFFSPAFELGFSCNLTDNLMISTAWLVKLVSVEDMEWKQYPWLIKLGEKDAFTFSVPVRLMWRF